MPVLGEKGKVKNPRENPTTEKREKGLGKGFWRERKAPTRGREKKLILTFFSLFLFEVEWLILALGRESNWGLF